MQETENQQVKSRCPKVRAKARDEALGNRKARAEARDEALGNSKGQGHGQARNMARARARAIQGTQRNQRMSWSVILKRWLFLEGYLRYYCDDR